MSPRPSRCGAGCRGRRHEVMRKGLALLTGLGLALAAGAAPTRPWTAEEIAYIEHAVMHFGPLESRERFADGARGAMVTMIVDGVHDPELHPEYRSQEEQMLQEDMCHRQAVVLARAHEPRAQINAAHTMIYSKTDFDIVEVLKGDAGMQPGDMIAVERRGGEVLL